MTTRRSPPPPKRLPAQGRPLQERLQSTLFAAPPASAGTGGVHAQTPAPRPDSPPTPISVTELTGRLGRHIEAGFSSVCVMGEVSKVTQAANGHTYFTLKDAGSTLDAILWASNKDAVAVQPKLGLRVVAQGAIRVFPPQGRYSLHVETLDLVGVGDLQRALEALKARLSAEGLFAEARKRPLPAIVYTVGVVTSPTGAVRQDIEQTLSRGGARVRVLISPTRVQGEGAAPEIAAAIALLSERDDVDIIIVARGGGSMEDLWPFNEEIVARAIAASSPPVISAVGHETDFTVSDFVADLRAATPSVAAGMVVDIQRNAALRTANASASLLRAMEASRDRWRRRLDAVSTHRVMERERTKLERLRGRVAAAFARARTAADRRQAMRLSTFRDLATRCEAQAPREVFGRAHARVDRALLSMRSLVASQMDRRRARALRSFESRGLRDAGARVSLVARRFSQGLGLLLRSVRPAVEGRRKSLAEAAARLDALSPLAVLSRGYALATTPEGRILLSATDVSPGDAVLVRLSKGRLRTTVTGRDEEVS
ncbi:MAG TPA: exodeoxyribonuclease VII large subunit [Vicinamibacteria bacterium]|nr:exodeoxyribonuclease VII large subunit [Vicinamibacteria bacterium]